MKKKKKEIMGPQALEIFQKKLQEIIYNFHEHHDGLYSYLNILFGNNIPPRFSIVTINYINHLKDFSKNIQIQYQNDPVVTLEKLSDQFIDIFTSEILNIRNIYIVSGLFRKKMQNHLLDIFELIDLKNHLPTRRLIEIIQEIENFEKKYPLNNSNYLL